MTKAKSSLTVTSVNYDSTSIHFKSGMSFKKFEKYIIADFVLKNYHIFESCVFTSFIFGNFTVEKFVNYNSRSCKSLVNVFSRICRSSELKILRNGSVAFSRDISMLHKITTL